MKPREVFAMLAVVGTITALVWLFGSPRKHGEDSFHESIRVNWDAAVDNGNQKLAISWMGIPRFPTASSNTWIQRMLEKRFNVELKPIFLDGPGFSKRKPLMFCAGDVPDVFLDYDPIHVQRDVGQSFVLELPYEVIKKYAPNYVKALNENGRVAWVYAYWKGGNYGLPTYGVEYLLPTPGLWRMDWLRKVGINKVPETLDEMRVALRKFATEDPDGNGKNDTYGFCPSMTSWSIGATEIFLAYGVLPLDWMERNGQVVWGGIQPEAKRALAMLSQWYKEGLIHPDFVSASQTMNESKFASGRTGYIYCVGTPRNVDPRIRTSLVSMVKSLSPGAEVVTGWFPTGPEGKRGGRTWGGGGHVICFGRHLAREPEKVIRVLKMFEAMATNENFFLETRTGKRGVHWDYGEDRGIYLLPPYDGRGEDNKNLLNLTLGIGTGFFAACGANKETLNKYLPKEAVEYNNKYRKPEWGVADVFGKPDVVPSASDYFDDLRQLQTKVYCEIIRGDRDVSYFDTFVGQWRSRGGDILTREANELNQAKKRIYRLVGAE